jgi:hypothetical protein
LTFVQYSGQATRVADLSASKFQNFAGFLSQMDDRKIQTLAVLRRFGELRVMFYVYFRANQLDEPIDGQL